MHAGSVVDLVPDRRPTRLRAALDRLRGIPVAPAGHDPSRLTLGRHSYGDPLVLAHDGDTGRVRVGSFTSIAHGVTFVCGGNHRVDWATTFPIRARLGLPGAFEDGHPASNGDIEIGHDVWLGREALILSGVTIGNGAVVAARSVVTRDVRPYAIVGGNPAKEIRRRFDDDTVDRLLALQWWTWPDERVIAEVDRLCSPDVTALLDAH
ncbi:antibiotic acetyltransferase [Conexibacter sp. W3-3-2]|nr:antibiotic acetyltransferase [Conexibacter sp. W3-3-2]